MPSSTQSVNAGATPASGAQTPMTSPPPEDEYIGDGLVSDAMRQEEEQMRELREQEDAKIAEKQRKEIESMDSEETDSKFKALQFLLEESKLFSSIMLQQMQKEEEKEDAKDARSRKRAEKREKQAEKNAEVSQRRATRAANGKGAASDANTTRMPLRGASKKNTRGQAPISSYFQKADIEAKAGKNGVAEALDEVIADEATKKDEDDGVQADPMGFDNLHSARQPALVTGGAMRAYQLEGLEWLTSLYENGLNGILADEMGLGKTIQTIALLAFLREKGTFGPFLIAAPLSTTANWVDEIERWTPDIPVVLYHGMKQDRAEIRKKHFKRPDSESFPVVVTSYEICMNDRKFLANFNWKFIIIDEGHRIKNFDCRLIRELQTYRSEHRLLITGTPLQNNLTELWSLLNFLMPSVFSDLEQFQGWFDFAPALSTRKGYEVLLNKEKQKKLVMSLHAILKPFLLRRVKRDVEKLLPKKREYVLFAPLTPLQRELYEAILDGSSRQFLEQKSLEVLLGGPSNSQGKSRKRKVANGTGSNTPLKSAKSSRQSTPGSDTRGRRGRKKNYEEISDSAFFRNVRSGAATPSSVASDGDDLENMTPEEQRQAEAQRLAKRLIGEKKLSNPAMQLRLCCDSPLNFFNPFFKPLPTGVTVKDEDLEENPPDETLIQSSGKMLLLDALLPALYAGGHKVLIFSQFKTQLDILEEYATQMRGWGVCRIDGSVAQAERQTQIRAFNKPFSPKTKLKKNEEPPKFIFLLSTRAGGQGINLAAADTVILFDSDWNPQQDAQAQDRAHRIGQTQNVLVYRFGTRNTIEEMLLEKAEGKRRLEKLVIRKGGNVRGQHGSTGKSEQQSMDRLTGNAGGINPTAQDDAEVKELRRLLAKDDGQRFDVEKGVLSERDLAILTDRSDEAYERAENGLDSGEAFRALDAGADGLLESLQR